MNGIDALRGEIAEQHGLDPRAATLLTGETIGKLEHSADELAKLVDAHSRQAPGAEADPITEALASKAVSKRRLLATITGRHPQPRDQRGRFAGFDGGARQPVPEPPDRVRDHDELVAQMARLRRTFGGGDF